MTWHGGDVNWVLATAQARLLAKIQLAKQHKCSINDVVIPYIVEVKGEDSDVKLDSRSRKSKVRNNR